MTTYLLWGGIAAMVPATLLVISIAYGLRALRRARAARVDQRNVDPPARSSRTKRSRAGIRTAGSVVASMTAVLGIISFSARRNAVRA